MPGRPNSTGELIERYAHGERDFSGTALERANLADVSLSGVKLAGANLRAADLSTADLSGGDLSGADLSHANLSGANLAGAELNDTSLSMTNLYGAGLSWAKLRGSRLSGANLSWTNLAHTDLSEARLNDKVLLILSHNAVNSDWVEHEVRKARETQKAENRDVLCPIRLDDTWKTASWPGRLMEQIGEYNILDFSGWRDSSVFDVALAKLLAGLAIFYERGAGR